MQLSFQKLHPVFVAEASPIDLREVHDRPTLEHIRSGMNDHAVLVFRDQAFTDASQLDFAQRFDGRLHAKTGAAALGKSRLGNEAVSDISNVDENGEILRTDDRRRQYGLGNRLWHTDASFQDPAGRYSMLSARVVPTVRADTEFADMRAAYDALDDQTKDKLQGLRVHEAEKLQGAVHPLVRIHPGTGRCSLYLAAHASRIIDWPVPEGRLLLRDLMEHATQARFVYRHAWRHGDLVVWDNRTTMHRGLAYDDKNHKRELRRVTTLDLETPTLL